MSLPHSYARCATLNCPLAVTCARKTQGARKHQLYVQFEGTIGCSGYIRLEEEDNLFFYPQESVYKDKR